MGQRGLSDLQQHPFRPFQHVHLRDLLGRRNLEVLAVKQAESSLASTVLKGNSVRAGGVGGACGVWNSAVSTLRKHK